MQGLSFRLNFDKAQTGQLIVPATVDIEAVRAFISMGLLQILQTSFSQPLGLSISVDFARLAAGFDDNWPFCGADGLQGNPLPAASSVRSG